MEVTSKYPHLTFQRSWPQLGETLSNILGQSVGLIRALQKPVLLPSQSHTLHKVALVKGAQATTAIEGNTLNEEEISKIVDKESSIPPSKAYLEREVENILDTFNEILVECTQNGKSQILTEDLIKNFHRKICAGLGIDGTPGYYRPDSRVVGPYRCPSPEDVPVLMTKYCEWLRGEFHFESGQTIEVTIVQAIVAHVYFEWIHPFTDGNGRTGRMIEFYILIRGGLPSICGHILSNYYNETRPQYYKQLQNASLKRSLEDFLYYAVLGLRDGLLEVLHKVNIFQKEIFWRQFIYDSFSENRKTITKKRQLELLLSLKEGQLFTRDSISSLNITSAMYYSQVDKRTITRDLADMEKQGLIVKEGGKFLANFSALDVYLPAQSKSKPKYR